MPKTKVKLDSQLVVRIDSHTHKKLKQRAEKEHRTPGAMARIILSKSLQREKV